MWETRARIVDFVSRASVLVRIEEARASCWLPFAVPAMYIGVEVVVCQESSFLTDGYVVASIE